MPGHHVFSAQYDTDGRVVIDGRSVNRVGVETRPIQSPAQNVQDHVEGSRKAVDDCGRVSDGRGGGVRDRDAADCVRIFVHPVKHPENKDRVTFDQEDTEDVFAACN